MKETIIILTFLLISNLSFGQSSAVNLKNGKGFSSVFQNLDSGKFKGSINGILIIKGSDGKQNMLDFQGSNAQLNIIKEIEEVYDVSTKIYTGKTTSGKTEIKYETYATANGIGIYLNGEWYEITGIDGACDLVIDGLEYSYFLENKTEYLVLQIVKTIELSNWQYLLRTEHKTKPENIDELKPKEKIIKLLPKSTLVFVISRN